MPAFIHITLGSILIVLGLYNMDVFVISAPSFAISYQLLAYGIGYLISYELRK